MGDVGKACSDEGWMEEMDGKRWRRGAWLKHTTPVAPCPVMFEGGASWNDAILESERGSPVEWVRGSDQLERCGAGVGGENT